MLNVQEKYITYMCDMKKEVDKLDLSSENKENFGIERLQVQLRETELLIPVVGVFSAGKSTLLNKFMGKNYLSTATTPETSLATELHFNEDEYVEAVKKDGSVDKFPIDSAEEIKNKAREYKYLKMYVNNQKIKDLQPLVLVDMPGFESPLDLHNQAILEYLDKGAYYVILTSVEDGTITSSMFRQLDIMKAFGKEFSFFISKSDLRTASDVEKVKDYIQEQIKDSLEINKIVIPVNKKNGEGFDKVVTMIEPEKLFESLFLNILKENYQNIYESINVLISAMKKDKNANKKIISELENAIISLENKKSQMLENAKREYSDTNINHIVDAVGSDLSNHVEELTLTAINSGQDGLSSSISSIVSSSLLKNTKKSLNEISSSITNDFARELSHLNSSMSSFSVSDDWLEKVSSSVEDMLNKSVSTLGETVKEREKSGNSGGMYRTITSILSIVTSIASPIVELLVIFLPDIIKAFTGGSQEEKQKQAIKSKLLTEIIPSIKSKVREQLSDVFAKNIEQIIQNISEGFEEEINKNKQLLEDAQKEQDENSQNIDANIALHVEVNKNIQTFANKNLY